MRAIAVTRPGCVKLRSLRSSFIHSHKTRGNRARNLDTRTFSMIFVVTGTSRGIGLELVRQVVARGDHVVAAARKPDESTELQELAKAHKDAIKIVQMDVQDADSIKVGAASSKALFLSMRMSLQVAMCLRRYLQRSCVLRRLRPRLSKGIIPTVLTSSSTTPASTPPFRGLVSSTLHLQIAEGHPILLPCLKDGADARGLSGSNTLHGAFTDPHIILLHTAMTMVLRPACLLQVCARRHQRAQGERTGSPYGHPGHAASHPQGQAEAGEAPSASAAMLVSNILWCLHMPVQAMYVHVLSRRQNVLAFPGCTSIALCLLLYKEKWALSWRSSVACADCQYKLFRWVH